ncbi:MAG: tRNA dihydrouridine synthase DusB [Oscillospiraceae bacterium]|nr:tRNA dihydrouridine synthase DusB [Oscillospiraceae bacterium]
MTIGSLKFPKTAMLAPMAGVADRAFREICINMGASCVVGEMASAKGLCYGSKKTAQLLGVTGHERPMAVQLFGDEPDTMARAAGIALGFKPDFIDINMGCPAPKITGGGSGAALMKNLTLAGEIIRAVADASTVPVTVKIRKGWDENSVNAVEAALVAQEGGAAAVTIHGRTKTQMYAPPVDLGIIKAVKDALRIPVVGNGDVDSVDACAQMYEEAGCDLVMIGRGALGRPWIFAQIKAYMERGMRLPEPALEEKMAVMLRHIALACRYKGERAAMREARSHVAWYLKGVRGAAAYRRKAGELVCYGDLELLARTVLDASIRA